MLNLALLSQIKNKEVVKIMMLNGAGPNIRRDLFDKVLWCVSSVILPLAQLKRQMGFFTWSTRKALGLKY